jgi:hypothetical protein
MWLFAGSQFLDLPSGNLRVAYEQEFFEEWYEEEFPAYDITDPELESFEDEGFTDATNYVLSIDPGCYSMHACTLDFARKEGDGRHADLVIFLKRSTRPKQNKSAKPLVGYAG